MLCSDIGIFSDIFDKVIYLVFCRFLALKNLATVFLQQGSAHYESALRCYLQAVEIDTKDSVIWNQLGTLSCSMGSLSISRWAFEQGLLCSPNNCKHFFCSIKYFMHIILYIVFYSVVSVLSFSSFIQIQHIMNVFVLDNLYRELHGEAIGSSYCDW